MFADRPGCRSARRLCSAVASGLALLVTFLATLTAGRAARADGLDDVLQRGTLRWGADAEGGGPYVFPDADNPSVMRGFEVELAEMLAEELGRQHGREVRAEFCPGDWTQLPSLLNHGDFDIVLNGYELTPERARDFLCSRPYYWYGLQLLARRDGPVDRWDDLYSAVGQGNYSVGALADSAAEIYLNEHCDTHVEVVPYDGNTDAMAQVEAGVLDATLQDDCIALFYADEFPELRLVGRPVGEGYYVVLVRRGDERLHAAINRALEQVIDDGRLGALYDRWDMSGRLQELALRDPASLTAARSRGVWEVVRSNLPLLLRAAGMTVMLSVVSMPIAMMIGLLVAIGRVYGPWFVAKPLGFYVEVLRGTPLMLQLFVIFFLLMPAIDVELPVRPAILAAVAGLAINYSAYEAEIYRAGLQAIARGQMEAALALGMTRVQAIRRIIVPQAVRIVIPPVTNDFIALFKDTSVCSVITVIELTKQYNILARSNPSAIVELAVLTGILYLMMSYPLAVFTRWSERR